jgi:hypothetical protein
MNPSIYRRQVIYVLQDSIRNHRQYDRHILKDVENIQVRESRPAAKCILIYIQLALKKQDLQVPSI